jgi:hypothetical protein
MVLYHPFLLRKSNVSEKKISSENQNIHFMFNNVFISKNRAVYEIKWKNMIQPERLPR